MSGAIIVTMQCPSDHEGAGRPPQTVEVKGASNRLTGAASLEGCPHPTRRGRLSESVAVLARPDRIEDDPVPDRQGRR
jgi:hypothetical protein